MEATAEKTFTPTPHPFFPLPAEEEVHRTISAPGGIEQLAAWYAKREQAIQLTREDPYNEGIVLPWWRDADRIHRQYLLTVLFGGNGSAKTWYGCYTGVRTLVDHPGSQVLFLHENDTSSVLVQQRFTFQYIPVNWRMDSRKRNAAIGFDPKNGFTGNRFITPNGSIAQFGNYNQDVGAYEGTAWKLIVADENLPLSWLQTLQYRLPRAGGKMIWTFTPINGLTPAIKHVTDGARTVRHARAPLLPANHKPIKDCPAGHMPIEQEAADANVRIRYVWTRENPFENQAQFESLVAKETLEGKERRAYGYARPGRGNLWPLFGALNLVDPDQVPKQVTRYHVSDPHGMRPVFMLWVAVDARGRHFIYREWPDMDQHGEWAIASQNPRKFDGDPGPAQTPNGWGVERYKTEILQMEGHRFREGKWDGTSAEGVFRRLGDPRAVKDQSIAEEGAGTSFGEKMIEVQKDKDGHVVGPAMDIQGAPGLRIEVGIQAITDLLAYDPEQPIVAHVNEPHLYIVRSCRNLIWALNNYTGRDGEKAACKDPIDVLRYIATAKLCHVDPSKWRPRGGGAY